MNLLTNAIHNNCPNGSVQVAVRTEQDAAVLVVEDTGPGIAPQDQPHLFERFYRVDKARSREGGGNGLGLAIVKGMDCRNPVRFGQLRQGLSGLPIAELFLAKPGG